MPGVAFIQGASRGIGLQFCKHILNTRPEVSVIASCRNPIDANELQKLEQQYRDRILPMKLDVTKAEDIENSAREVKKEFGKLDLLINCSAMLHPSGKGETSLKEVTFEGLSQTFALNSAGPLMMAKHFGPLLQQGQGLFGSQKGEEKKRHKGLIVNMSAKVGSITDNALGGWYSYRMTKSALNMATKNLSIELGRGSKKVICVALHPGTVDTDLSRPYHKNVPADKLFSTEYSVECLMNIINNLNSKDTGNYYSWDASKLPF